MQGMYNHPQISFFAKTYSRTLLSNGHAECFLQVRNCLEMWCSDEPNVLKAYNKERTYVTRAHFIVSLDTVDLSARKRGFAGTSLDS